MSPARRNKMKWYLKCIVETLIIPFFPDYLKIPGRNFYLPLQKGWCEGQVGFKESVGEGEISCVRWEAAASGCMARGEWSGMGAWAEGTSEKRRNWEIPENSLNPSHAERKKRDSPEGRVRILSQESVTCGCVLLEVGRVIFVRGWEPTLNSSFREGFAHVALCACFPPHVLKSNVLIFWLPVFWAGRGEMQLWRCPSPSPPTLCVTDLSLGWER